jgi:hypothetical protein
LQYTALGVAFLGIFYAKSHVFVVLSVSRLSGVWQNAILLNVTAPNFLPLSGQQVALADDDTLGKLS